MKDINQLLKGNEEFINETLKKDPAFFKKLSDIQIPEFLWIGCSDSRIPADKITNQMPGTIFVHRNIANQINPIDFNVLSVIYFSLYYLKTRKIIICGHYGCGGIYASILSEENKDHYKFLENWLFPIKENYRVHKEKILNELSIQQLDMNDKELLKKISDKLSEFNVIHQIEVFVNLDIVQQFKNNNQDNTLYIYGLIYDVRNGKLKLLKEMKI